VQHATVADIQYLAKHHHIGIEPEVIATAHLSAAFIIAFPTIGL
jgi:hypothetical protein